MKIQHVRSTHKKTLNYRKKEKGIASILFSYFLKFLFCIILLFVFAIFAAPALFDETLEVTRYHVKTEKYLHFPLKIALITDLHGASYGEHQDELLSKIKNEEPDLVVLAGDIVDDQIPEKNSMTLLEGLREDGYPMYYVSGNHEYWSKRIEQIKSQITSLGITVLEGHTAVYTKTKDGLTDSINISGIDDPENPLENTIFQLKRAYSEIEEIEHYKILIAHRPELIKEYVQFPYDLILSGHAHGGQWRIPFLLENGFYAPNQGFFPKYTRGSSEYSNNTIQVISRGLSKISSTIVPRILNRPELVIIEIESLKKSKEEFVEESDI
jgi:predicted MPP superfamily phosphohydrolase